MKLIERDARTLGSQSASLMLLSVSAHAATLAMSMLRSLAPSTGGSILPSARPTDVPPAAAAAAALDEVPLDAGTEALAAGAAAAGAAAAAAVGEAAAWLASDMDSGRRMVVPSG